MGTNIERLKKLKELAMRGVGGEKEQAVAILEKLMKKYGVSVDEIDETIEKDFEFTYHGKHEYKLLIQIAYKVRNEIPDIYPLIYTKSRRKCNTKCLILCTEAQKVEIEFLFDFYKALWKKEVDFLMQAYIQKHALFGDLKPGQKGMEMSQEDLRKLNEMKKGLSDDAPLLQITDGKQERKSR